MGDQRQNDGFQDNNDSDHHRHHHHHTDDYDHHHDHHDHDHDEDYDSQHHHDHLLRGHLGMVGLTNRAGRAVSSGTSTDGRSIESWLHRRHHQQYHHHDEYDHDDQTNPI